MRRVVDRDRLLRFMREIGREARQESTIYLTGASALLFGWRGTTIDIDMTITPDSGEILRALPQLKERYDLNIELVAPPHFIPELPGWQERSLFIERAGAVTFRHYDFYSQELRSWSADTHAIEPTSTRWLVRSWWTQASYASFTM